MTSRGEEIGAKTQNDKFMNVEFALNGDICACAVRPAETLLKTLRNSFRLTGAKPGCENGDCGACSVLVNGVAQKSCLVLTVELEGKRVTTIEGLHETPIQRAFVDCFAFQCGYCTPGFIVVAQALLDSGLPIDEQTVQEWLESNICRCTSYEEIGRAIRMAEKFQSTHGATSESSSESKPPHSNL